MSNDTDIILCAAFEVADSTKAVHKVRQIRIFDEGYGMLDVYADFAAPLAQGLHRDRGLLAGLNDKLKSLGYTGPALPLGDSALQERKLLVLEAPEEFCGFAKRHGWKDLSEEFGE